MPTDSLIGQRWEVMADALDERQRRLLAGVEAKVLECGGISAVALATVVSRATIMAGISEIEAMKSTDFAADQPATHKSTGARQAGGGRKKIETKDETLLPDLLSALRWTCKSLRNLADELQAKGHKVRQTPQKPKLQPADQGESTRRQSKP